MLMPFAQLLINFLTQRRQVRKEKETDRLIFVMDFDP